MKQVKLVELMPRSSNVYRIVHQTSADRRAKAGHRGWHTVRRTMLVVALVVAILSSAESLFQAESLLYRFLTSVDIPTFTEAITLRLGLLMIVIMSLQTYSDIIRGADRAVLDPHPMDIKQYFNATSWRLLRTSSCWPMCISLCGLSLLFTAPSFYAVCLIVLWGAWLGSVGVGYAVALASVFVARDPRFYGLLDALRGQNPRAQAAFIYAPGMCLAFMAVLVALASAGARAALSGSALGWLMVLPLIAGPFGFFAAQRFARSEYVRATMVLAEIDALWSIVNHNDEAERIEVYLESTCKTVFRSSFLTPLLGDQVEMLTLLSLKQGWRRYRTMIIGLWILGAVAAWNGLLGDVNTARMWLGALCVVAGFFPFMMAAHDPSSLLRMLAVKPNQMMVARGLVIVMYAAIPMLLGCGIVLFSAPLIALIATCQLLIVAITASFLSRRYDRFVGGVLYAVISIGIASAELSLMSMLGFYGPFN